MAHYYDSHLRRPDHFNFATNVVDYWASKNPGTALHWVSQDLQQERRLSFEHFSRQSHRIASLLTNKLGVKQGERILIITPRIPEWYVCPSYQTLLNIPADIRGVGGRLLQHVYVVGSSYVRPLLY